jgi:AcrR family transcriptional regulator
VTPSPRERIIEGAYSCVARYGLAKTTVEDAAREARVSRATVYRYFPGGKQQLIRETIGWEASRFFERLMQAVEGSADFATLLERALLFAHRAVADHAVLQKILQTEPETLLPELTIESHRLLALIKAFLLPPLQRDPDITPGLDQERAVDHVARLLLSFIGSPGRWDLEDPVQVRELVRTELLAGLTTPADG